MSRPHSPILPPVVPGLVDLASSYFGGRALEASDDFFAPKERLLDPEPPVFLPGEYTERGKWMDGWESRRRRGDGRGQQPTDPHLEGCDWCVIGLGMAGKVRLVDVDTRFFVGNCPTHAAIDLAGPATPEGRLHESRLHESRLYERRVPENAWVQVCPPVALAADRSNLIPLETPAVASHLRLRIFPDGGVARLRVWGEPTPEPLEALGKARIDLASVKRGGRVTATSDAFFGDPERLLLPGRPANMGDGWETRRRRGSGHDWVVIRLGVAGIVDKIEVDTGWFKGNAPAACTLDGLMGGESAGPLGVGVADQHERGWQPIVPRTALRPDHDHRFDAIENPGPVDHIRLNIFPDGGVGRLRIFGRPVEVGGSDQADPEDKTP